MSVLPDQAVLLEHLRLGDIHVTGQFMWGSNYTFLCEVTYQDVTSKAVYKPVRGERPLWDFPSESLAGREVAAYLLSEAGGWHMVPPTIYRQEAPAGPGSMQWYVEHDPDYHYFSFNQADLARTRAVALFDAVANNTDRKAGHILVDENDHMWLIDHGVCFHIEPKLRTVIWDFAGEALNEDEIAQLEGVKATLSAGGALREQLAEYLSMREIQAAINRVNILLQEGIFPFPSEDRPHMPWPPV